MIENVCGENAFVHLEYRTYLRILFFSASSTRQRTHTNIFKMRQLCCWQLSWLLAAVPLIVQGATTSVLLTNSCGPGFKGKCSCGPALYDNTLRYVVNCTDTGFRDTDVLAKMPNQTEVLIFTGNRITELPWNVFGTINDYRNLTVVDMSNNHIRDIRGKAYHHVASVEILILNHNNLTIADSDDMHVDGDHNEADFNHHHPRVFSNFFNLQSLHLTNAFADNTSAALSDDLHDIFKNSNLTKLNKLHLEQNEIKRFADHNVFCDLPSLRDLHLGDNYLSELNFNVLCLKRLRFLDLERNRFEQMRQKDLLLLDRLEMQPGRDTNLTVDFSSNPLVCDCKLGPFIEWAATTNVTVRHFDDIKCRTGGARKSSNVDHYVSEYKTSGCQLYTARPSHGHVVALALFLGAFTALLLVLIVAVIYMSRDRIKNACNPILTTVSKKVHYTTIKDDDQCAEVQV